MVAAKAGVAGIASAFGPLVIAAGAAYLIWKNWDDIAPRLQPIIDQLMAVGEGLGIVEGKAGRTSEELAKNEGWRTLGEGLRGASDGLQRLADDFDKMNERNAASARARNESIIDGFVSLTEKMNGIAGNIKAVLAGLATSAVASMNKMVDGIQSAVTSRLNAVWQGALEKIETVRAAFFNLWDKVTRRSYIPDMVNDIAAEMARLGSVMVNPATQAARTTTQVMRDMASDVSGILDRLFPEIRKAMTFRSEMALLEASNLAPQAKEEAQYRLRKENLGLNSKVGYSFDLPSGGPKALSLEEMGAGLAKGKKALLAFGDTARVQTVRVGQSFKDMADSTMSALQNMLGAIKGGGFLDILGAAVGLFTQLGSTGLFGKGLAANLNKVPAYAGGTDFHPGGLAMVGERGPELVNMPRERLLRPIANYRTPPTPI
ncbi:hypothetical protein HME9302_00006 [Alteripontixanthobacter maritimus]|uniref:Uncharacterized protein n=1 Tax=Alteripontixanthobacter maritimus TaxID=2161824 RepID=A0A369QSC4_9SPHN|nr:hypothetical protein [Alteripontixanthobacter maritimus]RDC66555.1 hypothetical protein HME9302_00006 [Alteripontixanthobacter maritimus]